MNAADGCFWPSAAGRRSVTHDRRRSTLLGHLPSSPASGGFLAHSGRWVKPVFGAFRSPNTRPSGFGYLYKQINFEHKY